jgi:hypothetical protein
MADITLGDGREITFDLSKITVEEYDELLNKGLSRKRERELLCAPCGLTEEEIKKISMADYKRLALGFIKAAIAPVSEESSEKN